MVKIQIQLPDELYRDLKRLAAAREWSLAETLHRAAEQLLARHPNVALRSRAWSPPVSDAVGWRDLSHAAVHAAALDDLDERSADTAHEPPGAADTADSDVT